MLIDCDTCTVRGRRVRRLRRHRAAGRAAGPRGRPGRLPLRGAPGPPGRGGPAAEGAEPRPAVLVELDEVERRAVRALAEGGLVPPLRHQGDRPRPDGGDAGTAPGAPRRGSDIAAGRPARRAVRGNSPAHAKLQAPPFVTSTSRTYRGRRSAGWSSPDAGDLGDTAESIAAHRVLTGRCEANRGPTAAWGEFLAHRFAGAQG